MSTKICACCGQSFRPDPRVKNHTYCSAPDCQKERCKQWRQTKMNYLGRIIDEKCWCNLDTRIPANCALPDHALERPIVPNPLVLKQGTRVRDWKAALTRFTIQLEERVPKP